MACMEHICNNCGHVWFNNIPRGHCPMCCSFSVQHLFDEEPDTEPFYDDEGGEDESSL